MMLFANVMNLSRSLRQESCFYSDMGGSFAVMTLCFCSGLSKNAGMKALYFSA